MRRREFLRKMATGAAAARGLSLAGRSAPVRAAGRSKRPNILFAISDDQSWAHTGATGDPVVKTPAFDRVAGEGALFTRAFCASPSCTPSRGAILTGQEPWRLKENANLWSTLRKEFAVYPDLLEQAGYAVGHTSKGWGPGDFRAGGRGRNPAGPGFRSFEAFFDKRPDDRPFCFWLGSTDPHRPFKKGSGVASGKKPGDVRLPAFLPDLPEVRSDILDYLVEVERWDRTVGRALARLERAGELDNTIVIVTSDNGMAFPRAKCNLYDHGTRMPLAIRWPERVKPDRRVDDFVSLVDVAPTLLEAAGVDVPEAVTGRSLMNVLASSKSGQVDPSRDKVFTGRERHVFFREGGKGYPCRALRTDRYLYIRNVEPERWPAGPPPSYPDCDGSPTKYLMIDKQKDKRVRHCYALAFEKRPAEELYDVNKDPDQIQNVAALPEHTEAKKALRAELDAWMRRIDDPRASGKGEVFDTYEYYGRKGQFSGQRK